MSAKLTLAALAAVLTVASIQGPAFARGVSPTAHDLRSDPAFHGAHGSRALGFDQHRPVVRPRAG